MQDSKSQVDLFDAELYRGVQIFISSDLIQIPMQKNK